MAAWKGISVTAGAAVGLAVYAALAIAGLGLVQYFLRPVHLAIVETTLGVLFVATGLYFLCVKRRPRQRPHRCPPRDRRSPRRLYPLH